MTLPISNQISGEKLPIHSASSSIGFHKQNSIGWLRLFTLLFVCKSTMEASYLFALSPIFGYAGFPIDMNIGTYALSIACLLLLVQLFPHNTERASSYLLLIMIITIFLPVSAFCWMANGSYQYLLMLATSFAVMLLVVRLRFNELSLRHFNAAALLNLIFLVYLFFSVYLIVKAGGIDSRAFSFENVYDIRAERGLTGIDGYLVNWTSKAFAPFYFAYFLYRNKKTLSGIVVLFQVLLYLTYAAKAYLFSIALMVMIFGVFKFSNFFKGFPIAMIVGNASSLLAIKLFGVTSLLSFWTYRLVFEPAKIAFWFYEFFSVHEKLGFAEGLIGSLFNISSPYLVKATYMVSAMYGNAYNCNTGMFSDAYANGGFFCMLVFAVIMGIILSLVDSISFKIPVVITVVMFSYLTINLMDGSLLTTLLTGGYFLLMILVFLLNSTLHKDEPLLFRKEASKQ